MINVDPRHLGQLDWSQPSMLSRSFELRMGDSIAGTLEFASPFGSLATARTAAGAWTFKRTGFFSTKVTARIESSEQQVALYDPHWTATKGMLRLASGEELRLKATNFWNTAWEITDSHERKLVTYQSKGVLHHGATVDVGPEARERADLMLLITLAWYVMVLCIEDAGAVAGA